jgi:hypothetical protein
LLWLATIIVHKICEGVKDDIKKIIMSEYAFTSRRLLFFGEYKFKRGNTNQAGSFCGYAAAQEKN